MCCHGQVEGAVASRNEMKDSAKRKLDGAERLLQGASPLPSEGAYLAAVATECALKSLLMTHHSIRKTEEIAKGHHLEHCFTGAGAHSVDRLMHHLKGVEIPAMAGELRDRMTNPGRPYSLRYGEEKLEPRQAQAEIEWARSAVAKSQELQ